jgi:hypothetical protein
LFPVTNTTKRELDCVSLDGWSISPSPRLATHWPSCFPFRYTELKVHCTVQHARSLIK